MPHSSRQRRAIPGVVLALVAIVTASCTSGVTPHPIRQPIDSAHASTDASASGPSGTSPSGGSGPAALGGGSHAPDAAEDPLGAVPSHSDDPTEQAVQAIFPGLYGMSSLGATVHGSTVEISSASDCAFASDVINAGQWTDTPVLRPHDAVAIYVDILTRGDASALLNLTESAGLCSGRIAAAGQQELTLTGDISARGPAQAITMSCLVTADSTEDPAPQHMVTVAYTTADASILTMATVPEELGTFPVDVEDGSGLVFFPPGPEGLVHAVTAAAAFYDPTSISANGGLPGVTEDQLWYQEEGATVTVTSTDPLAGTYIAHDLHRDSGDGNASLTADFSCS